jgi:hypothetical protein
MQPLMSALMATGWLALVTVFFWRFRVDQLARQRALALVPQVRATKSLRPLSWW